MPREVSPAVAQPEVEVKFQLLEGEKGMGESSHMHVLLHSTEGGLQIFLEHFILQTFHYVHMVASGMSVHSEYTLFS